MPPSLGTQLSGEVSDLPTQPKPDVFGCADEKSQLHESPGDHLGSCNGSRPECETFQPDVAPRKSQQHLEGSVEDSASRMEKLTVYTKPRLPSVSTHSLPAASSSTAMASGMCVCVCVCEHLSLFRMAPFITYATGHSPNP